MRWMLCFTFLVACERVPPPAFLRLTEARQLVSALQTELAQGAEAANRTLMQDATGRAAVGDARRALERDFAQLVPLVRDLSYEPEQTLLAQLRGELEQDRKLEEQLLALTGEGSNLAAQQLSFGEAHAAVDRFHAAAPTAWQAAYALRSVEALEGPHIAEADEGTMTTLERQMDVLLADVQASTPEAERALQDFLAVHRRILALSHRNTNVHALALAIGDKRVAHLTCARTLHELDQRLQARTFPATR